MSNLNIGDKIEKSTKDMSLLSEKLLGKLFIALCAYQKGYRKINRIEEVPSLINDMVDQMDKIRRKLLSASHDAERLIKEVDPAKRKKITLHLSLF